MRELGLLALIAASLGPAAIEEVESRKDSKRVRKDVDGRRVEQVLRDLGYEKDEKGRMCNGAAFANVGYWRTVLWTVGRQDCVGYDNHQLEQIEARAKLYMEKGLP